MDRGHLPLGVCLERAWRVLFLHHRQKDQVPFRVQQCRQMEQRRHQGQLGRWCLVWFSLLEQQVAQIEAVVVVWLRQIPGLDRFTSGK